MCGIQPDYIIRGWSRSCPCYRSTLLFDFFIWLYGVWTYLYAFQVQRPGVGRLMTGQQEYNCIRLFVCSLNIDKCRVWIKQTCIRSCKRCCNNGKNEKPPHVFPILSLSLFLQTLCKKIPKNIMRNHLNSKVFSIF